MKVRIDSAGNVHLENGGEIMLRADEALLVLDFLKSLERTLRLTSELDDVQTKPEDIDRGDSA